MRPVTTMPPIVLITDFVSKTKDRQGERACQHGKQALKRSAASRSLRC